MLRIPASKGIRMRIAAAACLFAALSLETAAGSAHLVADLVRRSQTITHSSPRFLQPTINGVAVFAATDAGGSARVWRSDGTPSGTFPLLPDFQRSPVEILGSTHADGKLYFGSAERDGYRIWRTDGSIEGTVALTAYNSSPMVPIAVVRDVVYLLGGSYNELWALDASGTRRLAGVTSGNATRHAAAVWNNQVYLAIDSGLWKSDGTAAGTVQLTTASSFGVVAGETGVLFGAGDAINGTELWKSDGTETGTRILSDLNPGPGSTLNRNAGAIAGFKSGVLFLGINGEVGVSDGSAPGTRVLRKGAHPGSSPSDIEVMAEMAYFVHNDGNGKRLWRSDGTESGTFAVHEGAELQPSSQITAGTAHVYYYVSGANGEPQLMATDGTPNGMRLVGAFPRLSVSPGALSLVTAGDRVFFAFDDDRHGIEPWIGDANGPHTMLADVGLDLGGSSNPREMQPAPDGTLHFLAEDDDGTFAWRVDGASGEVVRLSESDHFLAHTPEGVYFQRGTEVWIRTAAGAESLLNDFHDELYRFHTFDVSHLSGTTFIRASDQYNQWIWSTDGTQAGTKPLVGRVSHGSKLIVSGGQPYFSSQDNDTSTILWASDGDEENTRTVATAPGDSGYAPQLIPFRGAVYLFTPDALFKFSGAPAEVETVHELEESVPVVRTWVAEETIFFAFSPSIYESQLWKTDGTAEGTTLVRKFPEHFGVISSAAVVGSHLVFIVDDGIHGQEPWITDGTDEGTHLLRDIQPSYRRDPGSLFSAGGLAYFVAETTEHGRELWQTDGTAGGTVLTADVHRGAASSDPENFALAGDTLYFTAVTREHGRELWAYPLPMGESLSIDDARVRENLGSARVTIGLSRPSSAAVAVDFETRDGSAVAGVDYTHAAGTVTFAPGELVRTISVPILNDDTEGRLRSFSVLLRNATVPMQRHEAIVVIEEDDATADVSIRFNGTSFTVRNDGPSLASNVRACAAAPPYEAWWCPPGVQLPAGAEIGVGSGQVDRLLVGRVTQWETDPDPSNNAQTVVSGGFMARMFIDRNVLRTGEHATLTIGYGVTALSSSDPDIASIEAPSSDPSNLPPTATVTAHKAGTTTIVGHGHPDAGILLRVVGSGANKRSLPVVTIPSYELHYGVSSRIVARVDGVTYDGTTPTGRVSFKLGTTTVGEATVDGATATLDFLPPQPAGPVPLTATYHGDANFYDAVTPEAYEVQVNAFVTVRVTRQGANQFLVRLRGFPGHVPTGTVQVSLHPSPQALVATLSPVDDSTSSATMRIDGDPRMLFVSYEGDAFYDYLADYVAVESAGRTRAVRH